MKFFVEDVNGDHSWQASIPENVPSNMQGQVVDFKGPSIPYPMRNPECWDNLVNLGYEGSNIFHCQDITKIMDCYQKFIHYHLLFPCEIDQR